MIAYPRSDTFSESAGPPSVRIIGLGNAGVHLADRLQMNGHGDVLVMNTDTQSLQSSISSKKIALGQNTTHGLGSRRRSGDRLRGSPGIPRGDSIGCRERQYCFLMRWARRRHRLRSLANPCRGCPRIRGSGLLDSHFTVQASRADAAQSKRRRRSLFFQTFQRTYSF